MIVEDPNLYLDMQEFFGKLRDFELYAGEEIGLAGMAYPENLDPENGTSFATRCPSIRWASAVALRELGPGAEVIVAIVKREGEAPEPKDLRLILGVWEMRERTSTESDLWQPNWCLQGSPSDELHLVYRYPAGAQHVCQATVRLDRERYRGPVALDIFEALNDRGAFSQSD